MVKDIFLLDGERNIKDGKNLRVDAECKDVIIISSLGRIYRGNCNSRYCGQ